LRPPELDLTTPLMPTTLPSLFIRSSYEGQAANPLSMFHG
jgi:hypothetical protein